MDNFRNQNPYSQQGLYNPDFEHDNCGIGAVVNINGIKSHTVVDNALTIVEKLEHRAGIDADGKTGDGVGILTQLPCDFLMEETEKLGFNIGEKGDFGVGMFFFPQNELKRNRCKQVFCTFNSSFTNRTYCRHEHQSGKKTYKGTGRQILSEKQYYRAYQQKQYAYRTHRSAEITHNNIIIRN